MSGLFEVIAADDRDERLAARKAVVLAKTRIDQRFSKFLANATSEDKVARLDLIDEDFRGIIAVACEEVGHEDVDGVTRTLVKLYSAKDDEEDEDNDDDIPKPDQGSNSVLDELDGPNPKDKPEDELAVTEKPNKDEKPSGNKKPPWLEEAEEKAEKEEGKKSSVTIWEQLQKTAMGQSAKDFRMLADMIATSPVEDKHALAQHAARYLAQTNPNFDAERFVAAATGSPSTGRDNFGTGRDYPGPVDEYPPGYRNPLDGDSEPYSFPEERVSVHASLKETIDPLSATNALFHSSQGNPQVKAKKPSERLTEASQRTSEAVKTIDIEESEGPSPKMDKRKWTPQSVKRITDVDSDQGPNPSEEQDIIEPARPKNKDELEQIGENTTERQELPSANDSGNSTEKNIDVNPTKTFGDNGTDPVTSQKQAALTKESPGNKHLPGATKKQNSQYEAIKKQLLSEGKSEDEAKEIAARIVNEHRGKLKEDVTVNPIRALIEGDYEGFLPHSEVQRAIRSYNR